MSTLHIGTLAGNTTVNDVNKYADYEVQVKDLMEEISKQDKKDTFELQKRAMVSISECYPNYNVISSMPKSTFSDTFGYDMQKDISSHMTDFYAGKISQEELDSYFEVSYLFVKRFALPIEHTYFAEKCRISGLFRLLFSEFEVGNTYPMVCLFRIAMVLYVVWG